MDVVLPAIWHILKHAAGMMAIFCRKNIKAPTERVCKEAVFRHWEALKYIKNQTVELCMIAIEGYSGFGSEAPLDYMNEECLTEEFFKFALVHAAPGCKRAISNFMPYETCEKVLRELEKEICEEYLSEPIKRYLENRR